MKNTAKMKLYQMKRTFAFSSELHVRFKSKKKSLHNTNQFFNYHTWPAGKKSTQ